MYIYISVYINMCMLKYVYINICIYLECKRLFMGILGKQMV